jgi:GTP-binding protein Era
MKRCCAVSIIGKPNAGKSTLLNYLIGHKLAIVTPKVQTTRSAITGILTENDVQLIFIDTPGIFAPKRKLEKAMVKCAWSNILGVDLVILLIDSKQGVIDETLKMLHHLKQKNITPIIVFNKIDKNKIDSIIIPDEIKDLRIFFISALQGKGVEDLKLYIISQSTPSEWLYEEDDMTNLPMRFLASEITREQLFLNLQEELPYNLTVETDSWENMEDGSVKIHQVIIVGKSNYKAMILGNRGDMIKKIGTQSRINIEKNLSLKVHLFLFVKVRENWDSNPDMYNYFGLKLENDKAK